MKKVLLVISFMFMLIGCGTSEQASDKNGIYVTDDGIYTEDTGVWHPQKVDNTIAYWDSAVVETKPFYIAVSPEDSRTIKLNLPITHSYIFDSGDIVMAEDGAFSVEVIKYNGDFDVDLKTMHYDYAHRYYITTEDGRNVHSIYKIVDGLLVRCECYSDSEDWTALVNTFREIDGAHYFYSNAIHTENVYPEIGKFYTQSYFIDDSDILSLINFKYSKLYVMTVKEFKEEEYENFIAALNNDKNVINSTLPRGNIIYANGDYFLAYTNVNNSKVIMYGYGEEALYNVIQNIN